MTTLTFRLLEFVAIFIITPLIVYLLMPLPVLPFLWLVAFLCYRLLLMDSGFDRTKLWNAAPIRSHIKQIITSYIFISIILSLFVYLFMPEKFLSLLLDKPWLWLLIMIFYPLLSVYPQELIYRTFFFHRYGELFSTRSRLVWGSAMVFSFMHIIFQNCIAVLLTLAGGWIFASIYARTHSTFVVSFVHTLYGQLIFTVGLGEYFFHGTMRMLMHL